MSTTPLLMDCPDRLFTERLLLRVPGAGDGPRVNEAILQSWDALHQWIPWAKVQPSVEETETFMRRAAIEYLERKNFLFLMETRAENRFIGMIGLHSKDWSVPRFEIGYWIDSSQTGKGYMTEACHSVVQFAFEACGANRIDILVDVKNQRSSSIAERCGFVREGVLRSFSEDNQGGLRDMIMFGMVRQDTLAAHGNGARG